MSLETRCSERDIRTVTLVRLFVRIIKSVLYNLQIRPRLPSES